MSSLSRGGKRLAKKETMKRVVWLCLLNGIAWVWCSYLLAYLGRAEIAESLSKVALTEIIAVVLTYAIKATAENLSKNNQWPDKGTTRTEYSDDESVPINADRDA